MKVLRPMLLSFATPLLALLFSSFALVGCGGSKATAIVATPCLIASGPAGSITRTAILSGAQQSPTPVLTNATGYGSVFVDPVTRAISGSISFAGVTGTVAHIHTGAIGTNGGPVVALTVSNNCATVPAGTVLTTAQYDNLRLGNLYFNVHSAANVDGEIRGQIGVNVLSARLSAAQAGVTSSGTGTGFIVVDPETRVISGGITFTGFTATNAHIHTGAVGSSPFTG